MRTIVKVRIAACVVGVVVALFLFAYPTQSLLAQQHQVDQAQSRLDDLNRRNVELHAQERRLSTPAEIERQAREYFNMVKPGEKKFVLVKSKAAPTTTVANPPSATKP